MNTNEKVFIYPFINELVDSLFNEDFNNLINKNTESNTDKSVFMMFVNIYFMAYLHLQEKNLNLINENSVENVQTNSNSNSILNSNTDSSKKLLLKKMLSEVIKCSEKRQMCVALIKQINPLFNIDSVLKIDNSDNPDKNKFLE